MLLVYCFFALLVYLWWTDYHPNQQDVVWFERMRRLGTPYESPGYRTRSASADWSWLEHAICGKE